MKQEDKKDIEALKNLGLINPGFKTPENYFEAFTDNLFTKINEEELPKESGFTTPDNYFENLEESIIAAIPKEKKKGKLRVLYAISSVAAALVLYFGIANYQESNTISFDSLEVTDIEAYIAAGNMSIDAYAVASIDADLNLNDLVEVNISNDELNNYLDQVDPEFLFLDN